MKTHRSLHFFLFALVGLILATGTAKAQSCEAYFPMKKGAAFETSHFNGKDKLESITATTVLEESNDGGVFTVTVEAVGKDAKGKELSRSTFDVTCVGGAFHMDMQAMSLGQMQQMQGVENMEVKVESEDMVFPAGLSVGATLPDASMTIAASMNGMQLMNTHIKVVNRKVTAKEDLTTTAGKFACIVIEEDVESQVMGMNHKSHTKSWYSLGVGMVRTENSTNGKMDGYSILTKISGH